MYNNDSIVKDFLFCKSILTSSKAHDLFAILSNFLKKNNVEGKYCFGLYTYHVQAMSSCIGGLQAFVQGVAPIMRCWLCNSSVLT